MLKPQLPRAVLPEQAPVPDIPPDHLHPPVPGLIHDRLSVRPRSRRSSRAGPQAVARILRCIKARAIREFLHHARHVDRRQSARPNCPCRLIARNTAPSNAAVQAMPERTHRARLGIRPVRNADLAARALLVRFDRRSVTVRPSLPNGNLHVERHEFDRRTRPRIRAGSAPGRARRSAPRLRRPPWRGCHR